VPRDSENEQVGDIRVALEQVEGVERVVIDEQVREAWLILQPGADAHRVEERVAGKGEPFAVRLAVLPERRDRQRVRFVEVSRSVAPDQQVSFRVTLEWGGKDYHGRATGDKGGAVELRTIATAALAALAEIVPSEMSIRLAGIKQVRAFDADMVVVSLYRTDAQPHSLVGAVVIGEDAQRAAAVAVLSALNRLLGNYLQLP
jgi:hypothetical protein